MIIIVLNTFKKQKTKNKKQKTKKAINDKELNAIIDTVMAEMLDKTTKTNNLKIAIII